MFLQCILSYLRMNLLWLELNAQIVVALSLTDCVNGKATLICDITFKF